MTTVPGWPPRCSSAAGGRPGRSALAGRQHRLAARPVVPGQGRDPAVLLHLAARHAAQDPLRPADAARLEGAHPGLAGLDPGHRHRSGSGARTAAARPSTPWRACSSSRCSRCCSWGRGRRSAAASRRGRPQAEAEAAENRAAGSGDGSPASRFRRWTCRTTTASGSAFRAGSPRRSPASPGPRRRRSPVPEFLDPVKGFGVTFRQMFRKVDTVEYPEVKKPTAPRLPRPSPAQPLAGRAGEVHRLRAVRVGLPGRRDLRGGRRQHRRRSGIPPASGTAPSTRSTTCAASCAGCAWRPARPAR